MAEEEALAAPVVENEVKLSKEPESVEPEEPVIEFVYSVVNMIRRLERLYIELTQKFT